MDSGFQRNKNRSLISYINELQRQISELTFQIKEIDEQIFDIISLLNTYETIPELFKLRRVLRSYINQNINIIEQVKNDLIIC